MTEVTSPADAARSIMRDRIYAELEAIAERGTGVVVPNIDADRIAESLWSEADAVHIQKLVDGHARGLLREVETGLRELQGRVSDMYGPGLLLAEELCQKMQARRP